MPQGVQESLLSFSFYPSDMKRRNVLRHKGVISKMLQQSTVETHKDENITEALSGLVFTVLSESIHMPRLLSHFVVLQPEFKMD